MQIQSMAGVLEGKVEEATIVLNVFTHEPSTNVDPTILSVVLAEVLDLVEHDPEITAASDALYQVAIDFVAARSVLLRENRFPARARALRRAFTRYQSRLAAARLSALARGRKLA